jgi:hypothetical protein
VITAVQQPSTSGGRPSPRAAAWIAWSLWAVSVVLAVSAMILVVVTVRRVALGAHGPLTNSYPIWWLCRYWACQLCHGWLS